jgi:hypothetical protein
MYVMEYKIRVGEYVLKTLDSVKIIKSLSNLSDFADIVIPGTYINEALDITDKIKAGDKVTIELGYDNSLKTEFEGYLNKIATDDANIKLECTDGIYLFKKRLKDEQLENITLKSLLNKVIKQVNDANAADGATASYKLDCDFALTCSKFTIFKSDGVDVLKKIQDETKANIYFVGDTLHVHPQYRDMASEKAVKFDFARNIEKSDLKYVKQSDKKVEVEVTVYKPDGKKKSETFGNKGGIKIDRTLYGSDETSLKAVAENEYNLWCYDGFEGSFTGWLIPYVEPGMKAHLHDEGFKDSQGKYYKDGEYYVTGTETEFSSKGGSRKVTLGRRLG